MNQHEILKEYLTALYRDTREIALVLERYYDRRYHKNERYTL